MIHLTPSKGIPPAGRAVTGPRLAVGAIVFHQQCVLLVCRNHPPSQGEWAIPGGKVQWGETLQQAAQREILEETGIIIKAHQPVYVFDVLERDERGVLRFHYVIVDLLADFIEGEPAAGDDAAEARWVSEKELTRLPVSRATRELLANQFDFGLLP